MPDMHALMVIYVMKCHLVTCMDVYVHDHLLTQACADTYW